MSVMNTMNTTGGWKQWSSCALNTRIPLLTTPLVGRLYARRLPPRLLISYRSQRTRFARRRRTRVMQKTYRRYRALNTRATWSAVPVCEDPNRATLYEDGSLLIVLNLSWLLLCLLLTGRLCGRVRWSRRCRSPRSIGNWLFACRRW